MFWSVRIPLLHRPTDLGGVNQQLADLPLSHFPDVMHVVDVTQDGVFYCLCRRPRRSEGEDLGAEGGGQVQTQDRLQGEADG